MKTKRLPNFSAVIDDFSSAPFRLFFLTGCVAAVMAASCWSLAMLGWWTIPTDPLHLHVFFFLQSLAGAVYAGFLFTAIPEWTHDAIPLKRFTQPLWGLWLSALLTAIWSLKWGLTLMIIYWFFVLVLAAWLVWRKRDDRHISILFFVTATWGITVWLMLKAWNDGTVSPFDWQQLLHTEIMGVALITFRISRALGTQALEDDGQLDSRFIPNPFYKNLAIWLFYSLVISNLILHNTVIEGWINLAISGVMIGRLREWHFGVLLKRHYVRWLYLTLLFIGIGYGWRGFALIGISQSPLFNPVLPFHLIAIGGLLLMIYQVFNIAGLRHSGLDLIYPAISRLGLFCLLLATISRSLGVGLGGNYLWFAVYLPGIFVSLAFIFYAPIFYRIFMRYPAILPE